MLATLKEVLEKAEQGNYAVGAFNCTSLESGMAIVETAEELNSPVILQYADSHRHLISIDVIGPIMLQLAKIAESISRQYIWIMAQVLKVADMQLIWDLLL